VDFLLVLIKLLPGVTSENRLQICFQQGGGSVSAKFSRESGRPPAIISAGIDRPMNALQLCRR